MNSKVIITEFKWIIIALIITYSMIAYLNGNFAILGGGYDSHHTFLGLSMFLEILVFFIFSTFVVYGIKGFFENYSQKKTNVILVLTGSLMMLVIMFLSYQIFFKI
jgi:membrane protein implicated in regulation of membrane protease activity